MKTKTAFQDRRRNVERRRRDSLIKIGQMITTELNFNTLLDVVVEQTNKIMETERCSIFLIDNENKYLEAYVSLDLEKNFLLPKDQGIAGWVFCNKETLISNDPYHDPLFSVTADNISGFHTRNLLCTPLLGRNKNCIGTMQILNKASGDFIHEDEELIVFIAGYVSIAIENSILYEDIKNSDMAKEKAISHLSHELKTPLSIINTAFELISRVTEEHGFSHVAKPIIRGKNNVKRLLDLQYKIEDIVAQKTTDIEQKYATLIENIKYFLEEYSEPATVHCREIIENITDRINKILQGEEINFKRIFLEKFLKDLCSNISSYITERDINLKLDIEKNISVFMDENILKTLFTGLIKNAIENTPDNGLIEVWAMKKDGHIHVQVKDHGVGITKNNQHNIFKGLYHTQETKAYSSKRPYEFNAGGSGIDLLRMKVLSERLNFSIDCESSRCAFIPKDEDECPGKIPLCRHIDQISACYSSGGSLFTLKFPS